MKQFQLILLKAFRQRQGKDKEISFRNKKKMVKKRLSKNDIVTSILKKKVERGLKRGYLSGSREILIKRKYAINTHKKK